MFNAVVFDGLDVVDWFENAEVGDKVTVYVGFSTAVRTELKVIEIRSKKRYIIKNKENHLFGNIEKVMDYVNVKTM